jgi:hypothetical protein
MILISRLKINAIVYPTQKTCRFINGRFCFLLIFYKSFFFGDYDDASHVRIGRNAIRQDAKHTSAPEILTSYTIAEPSSIR